MRLRSLLDAWLAGKLGCGQEALSKEKLWMYQKTRLAATLQWALAHSPFYRRRLQGAGGICGGIDGCMGRPAIYQ